MSRNTVKLDMLSSFVPVRNKKNFSEPLLSFRVSHIFCDRINLLSWATVQYDAAEIWEDISIHDGVLEKLQMLNLCHYQV